MFTAADLDEMLRGAGGGLLAELGASSGYCIRREMHGEAGERMKVRGKAYLVTLAAGRFAGLRIGSTLTIDGTPGYKVREFPDDVSPPGLVRVVVEAT